MKTPEDDFFLGRTVLERKTVSREALLECLFQMAQERKAGNPGKSGTSHPVPPVGSNGTRGHR